MCFFWIFLLSSFLLSFAIIPVSNLNEACCLFLVGIKTFSSSSTSMTVFKSLVKVVMWDIVRFDFQMFHTHATQFQGIAQLFRANICTLSFKNHIQPSV